MPQSLLPNTMIRAGNLPSRAGLLRGGDATRSIRNDEEPNK